MQLLKRHYIGSAKLDLNSYFVDIEHNGFLSYTDPEFPK